jgi:hypothetical protein
MGWAMTEKDPDPVHAVHNDHDGEGRDPADSRFRIGTVEMIRTMPDECREQGL